ncbi:HD-GYP domain-containing protein [Deinococcus aquiradiocola]|uniref:Phosphohydrolase n=1 Tax=Deinococcus aquiradiocola TaxID=393059 RepID=A0A917URZ8_9DEIO|nr:HD domain-containing phosphohydrolase [Deinococcus aquiradiocola]GGJ80864.1 phosphohydrolase [Deinococcus aquiradiocola]
MTTHDPSAPDVHEAAFNPAAPASPLERARSLLHLTRQAMAAPDLQGGLLPVMEALLSGTAAVGTAYFEASGDQALVYQVRAAAGEMPSTAGMAAIAAHGLPANVPLLRVLQEAPEALFYGDVHASPDTQGFVELGVASLAAAPVQDTQGELFGALLMHTFRPHAWTHDERQLFGMVADTVASLTCRLRAEEHMRAAQESSLRALGLALEARDGESLGHTDRVTALALKMAGRLAFTPQETCALRWGAYLHDIGKIAVPDAVLLKRGPLDADEWEVMKGHVVAGSSFATTLAFLPDASLAVIAQHHERWDGSGYPWGMSGDEISLGARIFALCDVYDALVSERPYKEAWRPEDALAEVQAQAGRQFDPALVPVFVTVVNEQEG